jgi:hypothetical protein
MKIKCWKCTDCNGVVMSRHIPDNGICTACEAHQRAQKYIDRKDAKSNMMFGTTNPMDN